MDKATNDIRLREWAAIVREANNSGMHKKVWCEQNGISVRRFYYWQKKLREHLLTSSQGSTLPAVQCKASSAGAGHEETLPVFCELKAPDPAESQERPDIAAPVFSPELMLDCGQYRILVGSGIRTATLSTVLEVIRNA